MTSQRYGFADEHSNIITYITASDDDEARAYARGLIKSHGYECVEMWLDERDADGELPESEVVS